jgi:hypothetical protein
MRESRHAGVECSISWTDSKQPGDKKATLTAMALRMEDAIYAWQKGELSGELKLAGALRLAVLFSTGNVRHARVRITDAKC